MSLLLIMDSPKGPDEAKNLTCSHAEVLLPQKECCLEGLICLTDTSISVNTNPTDLKRTLTC